ncbi:MAG: lipid A export permease/ATP-binding protein MsbA [Gammaproteobacteria bacterium]|nr:lipid A export permease/ATP-binding protein MsbA [Gammaproteobacteria bacterium]
MAQAAQQPATLYRRMLGLSFRYWRVFILAGIAMIVYAGTDTAFALLVNKLLEAVAGDDARTGEENLRRWIPLAILLLFMVRGVADVGSGYGLGWIGRRVVADLRQMVFDKFMRLPSRFFDRTSSGALLSRLTFNIDQIAESISNVVTVMIREVVTAIGLIGYMVYLSPKLALFIFIAAPLLVFITRTLGRHFRRYSERIQRSMGDITRVAQESLQSQRVIKIFNAHDYEHQRFGLANERTRRLQMRLVLVKGIGDGVVALVAAFGLAAVAAVAVSPGVRAEMDLGDFGGFITALVLLMRPLRQLGGINAVIQRGLAAGESVFAVLDEPEEEDGGLLDPERVRGSVTIRGVGFSYDSSKGPVLSDIDLEVPAGQKLAIVGRSGSGKTTLVNLLPRFYEASEGSILIDGHDIREYSLQGLRRQISLVSQEVTLFNDTVANNIAYGALNGASRAAIEEAARAAHLGDLLAQLPQGLDTMVGDRGLLLSGGQRQRIAIARALLKDAPILILDEATSALDTESERHIQAAFDELMVNRTTFVIAHRLSTVENADRIIVMAEGRIVESGTHAELLAAGGDYATLHRMQFRDEG